MKDSNFNIITKIKKDPSDTMSSGSFLKAKNAILGASYNLELIFIGAKESQTLNKQYRDKDKPANVLSFPIDKKTGQIFISPDASKKDAPDFNMSHKDFVFYLFIHGALHLKGLDHGTKMDSLEKKFLRKFGIKNY